MPKTKIIHLLCHFPNPIIKRFTDPDDYIKEISPADYIKIDKQPNWIGFFKADHHAIAAKELLMLTDKYDVECWRPYGNGIDKVYSKNVDGITHRVFPGKYYNIPQVGDGIIAPAIFDLLKEMAAKENIILNISVGHAWFHIWLLHKIRKIKNRLPVICLHRSSGFKKFSFEQLESWKKLFKWYYLIENKLDVNSLKNCDYYFSGSMVEALYMKEDLKMKNSGFYMEGVDFEDFKPVSSETKIELRKKYNLPLDKKILIATGNFRSTDYGYQHLIKIYKELKKERPELVLVMIGGYRSEDLYSVGEEAGAIMVERAPKPVLKEYMLASDIYTQACFSYTFINHGGYGSAMIEAGACNLPAISDNIMHYPGTKEERDQVGLSMGTPEGLKQSIVHVMDNPLQFANCRNLLKKYFDVADTKRVLFEKYNELERKYFQNKNQA
ncbi:hypothetical protein BH10BAC5_BH10BAC5_11340 [soil metagenome]